MTQQHDASTLCNYTDWKTTRTELQVTIDFKSSSLHGIASLTLQSQSGSSTIILDTSYLDIERIESNGKPIKYDLKKRKEPFGSALHIQLEAASDEVTLEITYSTTSGCTALQWLDPSQTAGTKPYVFSQCQAIHARSMFPCQDTPLIKSTFTFKLRSMLPCVATGNAKGVDDFRDGSMVYTFEQPVPIPSYLAAIASGDLATAQVGPRSLVYTEPKLLHSTQEEIGPVLEKFIQVAESFLPKYAWNTYNVLVLPQSFPYGGMENPQITFATPTILAGDGSNLDVLVHELSHSWSGNLVSCAGWSHFWLNEGWTVFLERKILAKMHSKAHADFSAIIGFKALEESVKNFTDSGKLEFTKLVQNLEGVDPDDSFSSVPYEKGYHFLRYLEGTLGAERFEKFAYYYFDRFAGTSITSFQFKASMYNFFTETGEKEKLDGVDWNDKFYSTGLPPKPDFDTRLAVPCYSLAKRWIDATDDTGSFSADDVNGWDAGQFQVFLETLSSSHFKSSANVLAMDRIYSLTKSKNAEILFRYYALGLKLRARPVYAQAADFLTTVGRMKYVRPLFRALNGVDQTLARKTFEKVRTGLHPICRDMVRKDLGLK